MTTSAAAWAHVTLYYASFFAASALLEMFGCYANERKFIVEVAAGSTGSQGLLLNSQVMSQQGLENMGSHERFWNIFYLCSPQIYPWVRDQKQKQVLDPNLTGVTWQINTRNRVNYDSHQSLALMESFDRTFDANRFPGCLQGDLATQLTIVDSMTRVAFSFARSFNLLTDALRGLPSAGASRGSKIRDLIITKSMPTLWSKILWDDFTQ